MQEHTKAAAFVLGLFIFLGLALFGYQLGNAALKFKAYERSVTVKGLSEREYDADIVIWPIMFTAAGNDLQELYVSIESNTAKIKAFLETNGIESEAVTHGSPSITDRSAQRWANNNPPEFRYAATQTVTIYSNNISRVRKVMGQLSDLGKQGIVFTSEEYKNQTEYLFTRLNEIKPAMIEEATRNAREVAEKFADDSQSRLGKIKRARQGQFSISPRDKNNPHIKKVRVVSTIEYYLSD
jgi:hypothetical protein